MTSGLQPFLIANTRVGLERDMEPWLLPNDAYPELEDCYLWRGRVKKKQGYELLGRLNIKLANGTDGSGNASNTLLNVPLNPGSSHFLLEAGASTQYFQDPGGASPVTLLTNGSGSASLNRSTGVLTITGALASANVFYYPGLPVMGLRQLETTFLNVFSLVAFDTSYSYLFNTSSKDFNNITTYKTTGTAFVWTGTDSQFFWTCNYYGAFWATNNNPGFQSTPESYSAVSGDGIRWFDQDTSGWVNFLPPVDGSNFLMGALMLVPYKDSLIALGTWEGPNYAGRIYYPQRARWNAPLKTPYAPATAPVPSSVTAAGGGADDNTWRDDIPGNGDFIDAPTSEAIVSAEFVKDTLIVYFERSTWQLAWTGNSQLPFQWIRINTELGAGSTFSEIPFDKVTLGISEVGIHACDSVNVTRIDQKIPDETFAIQNINNGRQRVYGIRDFFNQLVYWTMPYTGSDQQFSIDDGDSELPPPGVDLVYPNKVLVYNYIDSSYSFFNDSFTCFGYYQKAADQTWMDTDTQWDETDYAWVGPTIQQQFDFIVAGNQQGFVEIFDANLTFNDISLSISNITPGVITTITSINHNLTVGSFVKVSQADAIAEIVGGIYKVLSIPDANTFTISTTEATSGTYLGGGSLVVVSNFNLVTKRFNPYIEEAAQVRLGIIDFYFDTTEHGQVTVNIYLDEDSSIPVNATTNNVPFSTITGITQASTAVISLTTGSGTKFKVGDDILVTSVAGMKQINGQFGLVQAVSGDNITVNIDTTSYSTWTGGGSLINLSQITSNIVYTKPESTYNASPDVSLVNSKIWKRQNFYTIGQLFTLQITMSDEQMMDEDISGSDIVLHGLVLYFSKAGKLINV